MLYGNSLELLLFDPVEILSVIEFIVSWCSTYHGGNQELGHWRNCYCRNRYCNNRYCKARETCGNLYSKIWTLR